MHWIDWLLVLCPFILVVWVGLRTQKYVKGIADFLSAGRVAGRYIVAVASGEAAFGLISLVATFEIYYNSGFGLWVLEWSLSCGGNGAYPNGFLPLQISRNPGYDHGAILRNEIQ